MDNYPKMVWTNSPRIEQDRLASTYTDIAEGFFERQGFVVLPRLDNRVNENVVVVFQRKLEYQRIDVEEWENKWDKVNKAFWRELEKFLPGCTTRWRNIVVRMTRYGTVSSSASGTDISRDRGVFYLRSDVDISHLAAMIINVLLYIDRKSLGITWSKREALMDFVMTRPAMKQLFPNFRPVMHQLSRVSVTVRKRSGEYLRELGIASRERELEVMGNKLLIKGKGVEGELTKEEVKILKYLVKKEGELVSYDELADVKWGEGEFRTFWAINRQVGRIRKKLGELGARGVEIRPVRAQGYILSN